MDSYGVEDSELRYDGRLSRVRMDQVRMPDGDVQPREIVEHPDAVAVVPIDDDGRVVLIRHYRHALGRRMLEIPAGILDVDGEAPEGAARRELAEEVGLEAVRWTKLVHFANSAGWSTECTTVYLATGLSEITDPGFTPTAEEADLEVLRVPFAEALASAQRGDLDDAKTLIGILLAGPHLQGR
jgi:8-oxo-dGDP phosphatase